MFVVKPINYNTLFYFKKIHGNPGLFFGLFKQSTNDKTINKQVGHFFHLDIGDRSRTFGHEFGHITIDHWTKTKKKT